MLILTRRATAFVAVQPTEHGLFYDVGMWLHDHWSEIVAYMENPVNLMLLVVATLSVAVAGISATRLGAWCLYQVSKALDARPGVITVGFRRASLLDFVLNPPIRLSFVARCMHVAIIAPTRQGKTTIVVGWAKQDLKAGHTVFILQVGGDLGSKVRRVARELGVPVTYFNPLAKRGLNWNPLATGPGNDVERVAEQAAATLEAISVSSDPYYQSVNTGMLRRMIFAAEAYACSVGRDSDLLLVKRFLEDHEYLREALQVERVALGRQKVNLPSLDPSTCRWFEDIYFAWNAEQRQKNISGLYLLLDEMLGRNAVAAALSTDTEENTIDLTDALSRPGLVLIDIPAAKIGAVPSLALGLWVLQRFQLETLDRTGIHSPVAAYFDEIHALLGGPDTRAADSFAQWLPQVGKFRVAVHLAYQGFSMLPLKLRRIVDNNASNKFVSGRLSAEDARAAQELLGTVEEEVQEVRRTRASALSGPGQAVVTTKTVEKWRYSVEQIRKLGRGTWFFVSAEDGNLKDPVIIRTPKSEKRLLERLRRRLLTAWRRRRR